MDKWIVFTTLWGMTAIGFIFFYADLRRKWEFIHWRRRNRIIKAMRFFGVVFLGIGLFVIVGMV